MILKFGCPGKMLITKFLRLVTVPIFRRVVVKLGIVTSKIKRDLTPCVEMKLRKLQRRLKVGIAIPEFDKENFFQNESLAGASRTPFVSPDKACRLADQ